MRVVQEYHDAGISGRVGETTSPSLLSSELQLSDRRRLV
jgi:hypothetical protein